MNLRRFHDDELKMEKSGGGALTWRVAAGAWEVQRGCKRGCTWWKVACESRILKQALLGSELELGRGLMTSIR